jgi:hypothetical protein
MCSWNQFIDEASIQYSGGLSGVHEKWVTY